MDRVQLDQAKLRLSNAETELGRLKQLYEQGGLAQSDYEAAELNYQVSKSTYDNLLENTILRSPISGVVSARNYDRGDMYGMAAPIFTVQQITPVKILVGISEGDYTKVKKGDVVVITHEGPKGGPGMQEMLYPTSYIKSMHMGKECALITDGRFSGGTSGLSIGHISPEAASGGNIGKIKDGDIIDIDIPNRSINVRLSDEELAARPQQPLKRNRVVSKALRAYAQSVASADKGGVRIID